MKDQDLAAAISSKHGASCTSNAKPAPPKTHSKHGPACCDGHHHHHHHAPHARSSLLGSILPILACALCPACIGVWAQVLSVVGIGMVITETEHHLLLAIAIAIALAMSVYRFARTRFVGPCVLTIMGCASLAASHSFAEENQVLSWVSMAVIVSATLWQRRAERNVRHGAHASSSDVAYDRPSGTVA